MPLSSPPVRGPGLPKLQCHLRLVLKNKRPKKEGALPISPTRSPSKKQLGAPDLEWEGEKEYSPRYKGEFSLPPSYRPAAAKRPATVQSAFQAPLEGVGRERGEEKSSKKKNLHCYRKRQDSSQAAEGTHKSVTRLSRPLPSWAGD